MHVRNALVALTLSVGLLPLSCADKKSTALVVAVSSEVPVPEEVNELEINVASGEGEKFNQTYFLGVNGDTRLPGTITVYPESGAGNGPVTVSVKARLTGGENRLIRKAKIGFSEEKTKLLRMPLRFSCLDFPTTCAADESCRAGTCVKDDVDVEALPEFEEKQVFGTAGDGHCFDRSKCVPADQTVDMTELFRNSPDADLCTLQVADLAAWAAAHPPPGATPKSDGASKVQGFSTDLMNVGIVWANNKTQKWTAVDYDAEEGWQFDAKRESLHLAPGLCRAIKGKLVGKNGASLVSKVIANPACPPKPPTQPECATATSGAAGAAGAGGAAGKAGAAGTAGGSGGGGTSGGGGAGGAGGAAGAGDGKGGAAGAAQGGSGGA